VGDPLKSRSKPRGEAQIAGGEKGQWNVGRWEDAFARRHEGRSDGERGMGLFEQQTSGTGRFNARTGERLGARQSRRSKTLGAPRKSAQTKIKKKKKKGDATGKVPPRLAAFFSSPPHTSRVATNGRTERACPKHGHCRGHNSRHRRGTKPSVSTAKIQAKATCPFRRKKKPEGIKHHGDGGTGRCAHENGL